MARQINIDVLKAMMDDNFFAAAYSDYLQDCAANYAKAYAAITEIANDATAVNDGIDFGTSGYYDMMYSRVEAVLSEYGFTGQEVLSFDHGYSTMYDALCAVLSGTDKYATLTERDAHSALSEQILKLRDAADHISASISVNDIQESLEKNLHAIVSTAGAAKASLENAVADRITIYNDFVKDFFRDSYNDISNSASYYKSLLTNSGGSACQIIANIISDSGIMNRDENEPESVDQFVDTTLLYQYTGASPVAALDFSSAAKVAGAAATVVWTAVKTIAGAVYSIGKAGFNWVRKKFTAAFHPNDLQILDDSSPAYTLDGWLYQASRDHTGQPLSIQIGDADDFSVTAILKHVDVWMKYDTIFAECLFKYGGYFIDPVDNMLSLTGVCVKYKPKCLNYSLVTKLIAQSGFSTISGYDDFSNMSQFSYGIKVRSQSDYNKFVSLIDQIKSNDLYLDPDEDNESNCWFGFQISTVLFWNSLYIQNVHDTNDYDTVISIFFPKPSTFNSHEITNRDFLQVAGVLFNGSGEYQDRVRENDIARMAGLDILERLTGISSLFTMMSTDTAFSSMFKPIIYQLSVKEENPLNYPFIPYRNGSAGFSPSRFGLRTDAENQAGATAFLTNLVIVVIVAVVAVTAFVTIRKIRNNNLWKKKEFCSSIEGKLARGEEISAADKKKYARYKRKLDASSLFGRNVQSSASSQENEANSSATNSSLDFDQLIRIITG